MTKTVEDGNSVLLHYRGTLNDGSEFDSSYSREEPMKVVTGTGQLIAGFDKALNGMKAGETKTFTLAPAEAYGEVDPESRLTLERTVFPEDFEFEAGMSVPLSGPGGKSFLGSVLEFNDQEVTMDMNHPLAGQDLTFEIEVLEIDEEDETTIG